MLLTRDEDLAWIAKSMGFGDCCQFLHALDAHREFVAGEFDKLLGGKPDCKGCNKGATQNDAGQAAAPLLDDVLAHLSAQWPEQFRARLVQWRQHPKVLALRDESRARLAQLVQRTAVWLSDGSASEEAALRIIDRKSVV